MVDLVYKHFDPSPPKGYRNDSQKSRQRSIHLPNWCYQFFVQIKYNIKKNNLKGILSLIRGIIGRSFWRNMCNFFISY